MRENFEAFLERMYIENGYTDMDMFWDWLDKLPIENIIYWAEKWGKNAV